MSDPCGSPWPDFETPPATCWGDAELSQAALQQLSPSSPKDDDAPSRSRAWTPAPRTPGWRTPGWQTPRRAWTPACRTPASRTPYHGGSSFVGSVLKAVSGEGKLAPAGCVLGSPCGDGDLCIPCWGCALVRTSQCHPHATPCGFPGCSLAADMGWVMAIPCTLAAVPPASSQALLCALWEGQECG